MNPCPKLEFGIVMGQACKVVRDKIRKQDEAAAARQGGAGRAAARRGAVRRGAEDEGQGSGGQGGAGQGGAGQSGDEEEATIIVVNIDYLLILYLI
jgi:hypothetical protein